MNKELSTYMADQAIQLVNAEEDAGLLHINFPDKWVAASTMQKAIRRGEAVIAKSAAIFLSQVDARMLRRRLAVIAIEDVGVASTWHVGVTVYACLKISSIPEKQRLCVYLACASALANAAKERSGDQLQTALMTNPCLRSDIDALSELEVGQLRDIMLDSKNGLIERTIAGWFLAGVPSREYRNFPDVDGDRELYLYSLESLHIPFWMPAVVAMSAPVVHEPMFWTFPIKVDHLAADEMQVVNHELPHTVDTFGVPHYALDRHTRIGKAAVRALIAGSNELRDFLGQNVGGGSVQQTLEWALFTLEGGRLNREAVFSASEDIKRLGQETDMCQYGLRVEAQKDLLTLLLTQMDNLHDIRAELIMKAMKDGGSYNG
ncbi:hypothetical protein [Kordiimonas sp.]|uniref:hypothetical protein n=1 Tax=Kordiimonas sp. TaxID=1970157 RepID=UPI003A924615